MQKEEESRSLKGPSKSITKLQINLTGASKVGPNCERSSITKEFNASQEQCEKSKKKVEIKPMGVSLSSISQVMEETIQKGFWSQRQREKLLPQAKEEEILEMIKVSSSKEEIEEDVKIEEQMVDGNSCKAIPEEKSSTSSLSHDSHTTHLLMINIDREECRSRSDKEFAINLLS